MNTYLLGVATVFGVAYLAFGFFAAYQQYTLGRPSKWRHNGPPMTWCWGMRTWVWLLAVVAMPVLWPIVLGTLRANQSWNRRRWNQMEPEQRQAAYDRFWAEYRVERAKAAAERGQE